MAKARQARTGVTHGDAATAVRERFRDHIGADRYAVWFGEAARFVVERTAAEACVTVFVGSGFTHDWLRRTFQADVLTVARDLCGPRVRVAWEPSGGDVAACPPASPADTPRRSGRRPRVAIAPESVDDATGAATGEPPRGPVDGFGARPRPAAELTGFVVGPSNRMAFAAIERVAARPGEMSPLVIHGPSGVGKTHLLEGVCARVRHQHRGAAVVSLSAEQFTNGFLQALHAGGLPGFRRGCRSADLLVVDDIQFLVGKRATLLEFQLTVDALHRAGRQMVFACDRELDALDGLGADLVTRLRGGMCARILPPDYDVRRGIVAAIAATRGLALPDDVAHYVASHMTRHARELFGAVNRLEATSLMLGMPIASGMAEEALADLVRSSARSVRLADVERAVCKAFGLEPGMLQSSGRGRAASHPRMLAMFLARKHTHAALAEIGRHFGRRSHSTVLAAQKTVAEWVAQRSPVVLAGAEWDAEEAIRRVEDLLRTG